MRSGNVELGRTTVHQRQTDLAETAPAYGWRLAAWAILRLTGLALVVLVLGHFALTHFITDVADTDSSFVSARWASWFWRGWDWLLLTTTLAHAGIGTWIVIADHTGERRRLIAKRTLLAVTFAAWMLGTGTLVAVSV